MISMKNKQTKIQKLTKHINKTKNGFKTLIKIKTCYVHIHGKSLGWLVAYYAKIILFKRKKKFKQEFM